MKTKNIHEKEHVDELEFGSKDFIDPDKNVISLFDTDILVQVVNGKIDLNKVALLELMIIPDQCEPLIPIQSEPLFRAKVNHLLK